MNRMATWVLLIACVGSVAKGGEEGVVKWDFTKGKHGWIGNPRVGEIRATADGLYDLAPAIRNRQAGIDFNGGTPASAAVAETSGALDAALQGRYCRKAFPVPRFT